MSRILFKLVFDILDNFFPIHLQDVPIVVFFLFIVNGIVMLIFISYKYKYTFK